LAIQPDIFAGADDVHLDRPVPAAEPAVADPAPVIVAHDLVHIGWDDLRVGQARRVEADARLRSQAGIGHGRQDRAGRPAISPDPNRLARPGKAFAQLHHLQHIAAAVVFHIDEAAALDDIGVAGGGGHGHQCRGKGQDQAKSFHGAILPIGGAGENHVQATVRSAACRPTSAPARGLRHHDITQHHRAQNQGDHDPSADLFHGLDDGDGRGS
jgi:hypothetical protein